MIKIIKPILLIILLICSGIIRAQTPVLNIHKSKVKVEEVLREIKTQLGYDFIYNDDLINVDLILDIDEDSACVEQVLNKICTKTGLQYRIIENTIVLKPVIIEEGNIENNDDAIRQTIRGKVFDAYSKTTLPGATVILTTMTPNKGTTTNSDGTFNFKGVPVGRHSIKVSFVGYQPQIVSEILLISAKESYVNVALNEATLKMGEVTVKPTLQKDKPLNTMASVSARAFTVEESQRYAGGVGDPTRMASSYAGVSVGYELDDNAISVRGHRPGAIVWRLEDVEIPNPNHFAGAYTAGAGFACLISNQLMDNSDFYTGAFPAEIGNSLSAAFDLKLRTGNNNRREYTFQAGVLGIDFASEGPFTKGGKASYNINYRYSTLGLLTDLRIIDSDFVPRYQDLTYKLNFPTEKMGTFTLWGTGGIDYSGPGIQTDSSLWKKEGGREGDEIFISMGANGFSHRYNIGKRTFVKTSVVASGAKAEGHLKYIDDDLIIQDIGLVKNNTFNMTFSTFMNHRFSAKHTNRTGLNYHNLNYNIDLQYTIDNDPSTRFTFGKEENSSSLMQFFTQSKITIASNLNANIGIHAQYFKLNDNYTIEPRAGLNWQINSDNTLSAGYGKHSQIEELRYYFIQDKETGEYLNKDLDFAKAHHFVLGYDRNINDYTRFKVEPYYQILYNYPGIPDSSFSMINMEQDWLFDEELKNVSNGINYGVDITFERFLHNNYYYLFTGSLFKSKYKGDDGVIRNARFDRGYTVNLLFGKEYFIGSGKNNILSANIRTNVFGGKRKVPINWDASEQQREVVYDYSRIFEDKDPFRCYVDLTVRFRRNKENYTGTWSLEILNLIPILSKKEYYKYNETSDTFILKENNNILVPFISYKVEF